MPDPAPHPNRVGHSKSVLIVDQSVDSRDVMRTALERRGVTIHESPNARDGLNMLRQFQPDVVILDLETEAADDVFVRAAYDDEIALHRAEMVILGNLRRDQVSAEQHVVRKPYHYAPLIETIERLVHHRAARSAAASELPLG